MQWYERRIGRVPASVEGSSPLTQIDVFGGSNGSERTSTDNATEENAQQNPIVH
jgi:hypothetical protein